MKKFKPLQQGLWILASTFLLGAVQAEDSDAPVRQTETRAQLDRLELDTTSITGNQELPKVLYIVPWKQAGIGDLNGKPVNSLLDEVLTPLDRDVFRRQVRYFDQLYVTATADTDQD